MVLQLLLEFRSSMAVQISAHHPELGKSETSAYILAAGVSTALGLKVAKFISKKIGTM